MVEREASPEPENEAQPTSTPAVDGQAGTVAETATASASAEAAEAVAVAEPATEAVAAAPDVQSSEPSEPSPEASASDASPSGDGANADGDTAGQSTAEAAPATEGGDGPKRKRKRKRKRKAADGTPAPDGEEGQAAADRPKKKETHVPFGHLFTAGRAKRHAFAVGEVVAGRVLRCEDGGIVVDLFGKAQAVADEHEPRELPPQPMPQPVPEPVEAAPEGDSGAAPEGDPQAALADASTIVATGATGTEAAHSATAEADAPADDTVASDASTPVASSEPVEPEVSAAAGETPDAEATVDEVSSGEEPSPAHEHDGEGDADETSTGGVTAGGRALSPAPVVPLELPRLEAAELGSIYRGRVGAISESGHIAILNRNIDSKAVRAAVEHYRSERRRVEGLVFGFNRGGFDIIVEGIRGFCPASAMSLHEISDPNEFVGRKFQFLLPQGKSGGKDVVVSRRSILERDARRQAKELLKTLKPGTKLTGRVSSVREFGVFVDIGGFEGLVHQSELSYAFGTKPEDVASVGDIVEVQVLRVGGDNQAPTGGKGPKRDRRDKRERITRVSLSMKALLPDPWDDHKEAIAEGTVQTGKVTRTTDFGAFIELAPGIEGLLHITELGRELKHANQVLKDGEELQVIVERADRSARRISLSRLSAAELQDFQDGKLTDPSAAPKNLKTGSKLSVTVAKVEQRGIHVRIAGAIGKRARGYIPGSETGLERGSDLRKAFPAGEEVEIKVIGTDRDGGLRCSVKALQVDEERRAIKDYRREASAQGFGTFGDLLKAKLGGGASK